MRIEQDNPPITSRKETTFKASKKTQCNISDFSDNELDEEEENIVKKLKNIYKGKIPFKFFNCGKIGYFAHKFPYANTNVKEEFDFKKTNKRKIEKKKQPYRQRKNLYTNEDNNSSYDSDSEEDEILFMGLETQTGEDTNSIEEKKIVKDAELNLEVELISVLEEKYRLKDKNRKQRREL